jgi:hypothetical protein
LAADGQEGCDADSDGGGEPKVPKFAGVHRRRPRPANVIASQEADEVSQGAEEDEERKAPGKPHEFLWVTVSPDVLEGQSHNRRHCTEAEGEWPLSEHRPENGKAERRKGDASAQPECRLLIGAQLFGCSGRTTSRRKVIFLETRYFHRCRTGYPDRKRKILEPEISLEPSAWWDRPHNRKRPSGEEGRFWGYYREERYVSLYMWIRGR